MFLKRHALQLVLRTFLLFLSLCALSFLIFYGKYWFTAILFVGLIGFQLASFYQFTNQTNKDLSKLFYAIKHEDYSVYFEPKKKGIIYQELYHSFNQLIKIYQRNEIEKEGLFQQFKTILEHINHGIISLKEDLHIANNQQKEIIFINQAATKLLGITRHKHWHRLMVQHPQFCAAVNELNKGGKQLLTLKIQDDDIQIALEVIKIKILDINYTIVSFQDIKTEIEQKETEAWYKLIRVLAHEMLNSFTPVSSLADTIKGMTEQSEGTPKTELDENTIKSIHLASSTIKRRSDSLLEFVNDYRLLTEIPHPKLKPQNINELFDTITYLMQPQFKENNITLQIDRPPKMATVSLDAKLIEQSLINLINNSINALKETKKPVISLNCKVEKNKSTINVTDNGMGIAPEIIDKIFIPFFTTRKNGSGIGLSLSKNIMSVHHGRIMAKSNGIGTTISLIFYNQNR